MTAPLDAKPGRIVLTRPSVGEAEEQAVLAALRASHLGGNDQIGRRVQHDLAQMCSVHRALLTPSATAAMEMSLLACDIGPGDEVLMPSFAFVSQANAILARGATPIFCDIELGTLNICSDEIERRLTARSRMIMPVHYAGISCDMDRLMALARDRGLRLVEDAAQGIGSTWRGRPLGTVGDIGCISFHVTKNLISGEGGAFLTDDPELARKAEIIQEKGTNRSAFLRGEVDKYTWVGPGGSYVLSDLLAALLEVQLSRLAELTEARRAIWETYHAGLAELEAEGLLTRPVVPEGAAHNGHIYWVLARTPELQDKVLTRLREVGVGATFHFQPLHNSPYAREKLGDLGELPNTRRAAESIVRLPLHAELSAADVERVVEETRAAFRA
ncbi:dTDP-4-amino-4,6-dideoxygalactose transaminase [Engelhardtia mirabilis]